MAENEIFLTKKQMRKVFTISGSGLYRWVQRGLPKDGRRFPLGPCLDWVKRNIWYTDSGKSEMAEEKLAFQRARTRREELRVQQEEKSLIPRNEAIHWLSTLVSEAKAGFMNLPRRFGPVLAVVNDEKEVEELLRKEIWAILRQLAAGGKRGSPRPLKK